MTAITITLSDDEVMLARERAAREGFNGIEDYLHDLVAEGLRGDEEDNVDYGAPEELRVTSKERLQELILEGLESPKREITKEDWARMRRELIERYGPQKSQ